MSLECRTEGGYSGVEQNVQELQQARPALQREGPIAAEGVNEGLYGGCAEVGDEADIRQVCKVREKASDHGHSC